MSNTDPTNMPESTRGEIALTVGKIAASFLPVFGGAASEVLGAIVTPLLEKRRKAWFERIARGLEDLRQQVELLTPESLSHNESFVTTFLHASQTAMRNHQQEKLEALRNAVLNAALPNAPEDDLQLMFLDAVDTLTTGHLRMLAYFDNPRAWVATHGIQFPNYSMGGAAEPLEHTFPELKGKRPFYDVLYNELASRGFLDGNATSLHISLTGEGMVGSRTTQMGKQFIRFITSPIQQQV